MTDTRLSPRTTVPVAPWYREPLTWLVFGLPAAAVVASFVTLAIAINHADSLVADDYYMEGLQINQALARERQADAEHLDFVATVTPAGDVSLNVSAKPGFDFPATLTMRLTHATLSGLDQAIGLRRADGGNYRGIVATLVPGRWYVEVATAQWRVLRRLLIGADGGSRE